MLLKARNDKHWYPVEVQGRFSMEAECAASPVHRTKAIEAAVQAFIENQKRSHNSTFAPEFGMRVSEPLPHVEFSEDVTPDTGPSDRPDPRDRERWEAYERAEKARAARKMGLNAGMVDFVLTGRFWRNIRQQLLTIAPENKLVIAK